MKYFRKKVFWLALALSLAVLAGLLALGAAAVLLSPSVALKFGGVLLAASAVLACRGAWSNVAKSVEVEGRKDGKGAVTVEFLSGKKIVLKKAKRVILATSLFAIPAELVVEHDGGRTVVSTFTWFEKSGRMAREISRTLLGKNSGKGLSARGG